MKRFLYIILLFIVGCNSNTVAKKPDHLISLDKMSIILTDIYIAKSADFLKNLNGDKKVNYHGLIYKKHHIDSISFSQSLKYYTADISMHEEILKQVDKNIKEKLSKLNLEGDNEVSK